MIRIIKKPRTMLPFIFMLIALPLVCAQSPGPSLVNDCQPCTYSIGGDAGVYSFTFVRGVDREDQIIKAIEVSKNSKTVQRLDVTNSDTDGDDDKVLFGVEDINFDGYADLMIETGHGIANAYADYWIFDSKSGAFIKLGNYPILTVDAKARSLKSYERGGCAGMDYDSKEYTFLDGKIVLIREEKQSNLEDCQTFYKFVQIRTNGVMKTVFRKTIRAPK